MSLLLLFAYPNPASIPIGELVTTPPSASNGFAIQREATAGEWRWVVELADPADGTSAIWRDITTYYCGDRHQFGADTYKGDARARLVQVQLQIDDSDMLAPWGQDTSSIFGVDVRLDAGMLMRASFARVDTGVVVEWLPIWTGRVESWGDESGARGQVRRHVVSVVDTIADLANVPTVVLSAAATWPEYVENQLLPAAGWLFGVDIYGDAGSSGGPFDDVPQAAINRLDGITDFQGLVWRSLRAGRLVIHPAPWDTTNVDRYDNPLLDVYPDGLKFSYSPDFTDIEYIADDDQQPFGIERTVAGVINFITITYPGDLGPEVYATDDPVSIGRYGVRPLTASWLGWNGPQAADDILNDRAFASSQALPLRTTLDHEGFWSAMAIVDHLDPVTIVHATSDEGLVVTATGTVRNIVEERTFRGEAGGDYALSWQSTVQVDLDATETAPALLPVEDLLFVSSESSGSAGPSTAEFTWTNPTQPSITPTEVQIRVPERSFIWSSEDYPGTGADGTTVNWLEAGRYYTFQVRLIRRVNGVITNASAIRQVRFFTPNRIFPIPIPDGTDTDVEVGEPPDFDPDDCELEVELQENDGLTVPYANGWTTVDTFDGSELTANGDGTWSLTTPIPNSFFNAGSMYRFRSREICGTVIGDWYVGTDFDPPDDWADPCTTPPALSVPPFNDASLLVYVPKICAPDVIREAVSGHIAAHGDALAAITTGLADPDEHALLALADPLWSATTGGILASGYCPQIAGHKSDKTITIRVNIVDNSFCVLGECAALRLTCSGSGSTWNAGATVNAVDGTMSVLSGDLAFGTYVITADYVASTGTLTLKVDGVEVDTETLGAASLTINSQPTWSVGAPPESWVTDFALFGEVVVVAPALPDAIMALTPARYLKLQETGGATAADASGNGRTGTYSGVTLNAVAGSDGFSYPNFDGSNDGVGLGDHAVDTITNSGTGYSLFFLIRADTFAGQFVMGKEFDSTETEWLIQLGSGSGGIEVQTRRSGLNTVASAATTGTPLATGTWKAVAITWVNANTPAKIYVNGVLQTTTNSTPGGAYVNTTAATELGGVARLPSSFRYDGSLAHVAMFADELNSTEVGTLMSAADADGWY